MKLTGKKIIHFLSNHYEATKALYLLAKKQNRLIRPEQLHKLKEKFGLQDQWVTYRIIAPYPGEGYYFETHYFQFIAYIERDASLDLPEQLGKYQQSIHQLTQRLTEAAQKRRPNLADIIGHCIEELHRFKADLIRNTQALEEIADQLRHTPDNPLNYTQRVVKAAYLVDTFLQPLNRLLAQDADAFIQRLRHLGDYTHSKHLKETDPLIAEQFQQLYQHVLLVEQVLEIELSRLVNHLLPLLEQLALNNHILRGLKKFRTAYLKRQAALYDPLLPRVIKRRNNYVYNAYAAGEAQSWLSSMDDRVPAPFVADERTPWTPPLFVWSDHMEKLAADLPVSDFFSWCFEQLKALYPEKEIASAHFFEAANLLFNKKWRLEFEAERITIQLKDGTIEFPKVCILAETPAASSAFKQTH